MMRQPPLLLLLLVCCASAACSVQAIYCGKERCYDILGVKDNANATEIKKKYYKMSLQLHPDKNPDPEAKQQFQRVAQAYEVLSDPRSRKNYDYALAHPEDTLYNEYQYYYSRYEKVWKTDPKFVVLGFLAIISVIQYASRNAAYTQAMSRIRQTPRYLNRRAQLLAELDLKRGTSTAAASKLKKRGSTKSKRGGGPALSPEDELALQQQLDAEIGVFGGHGKPSVKDTLGFQVLYAPVRVSKYLHWLARWEWDYKVQKKEFAWQDAVYLTENSLKMGAGVFEGMSQELQKELVEGRLWLPENLAQFQKDVRRGKRKLPKMMSLERESQDDDPWADIGE